MIGMTARAGRPPSEDPRNKVIPVRLSTSEADLVTSAAAAAGQRVGVWLRAQAVAAAKRQKRRDPGSSER